MRGLGGGPGRRTAPIPTASPPRDCRNPLVDASARSVYALGRGLEGWASQMRDLSASEVLLPDFVAEVQRPRRGASGGVSVAGRAALLKWVLEFTAFFGLSRPAYCFAVGLIDRFLGRTLVKPEHADLLGVACLYMAAQLMEPAELRPTLRELRINCDDEFTEGDISRMQSIVVTRLGSPRSLVLPITILGECVRAVDRFHGKEVDLEGFSQLAHQSMVAASLCYEALAFRPSTWVLAIVAMQLEKFTLPDTAASRPVAVTMLAHAMEVPYWDLAAARTCLVRCMAQLGGRRRGGP